jgi:hypothetical protein
MQEDEPAGAYFPGEHSTQVIASARDSVPAGHCSHTLEPFCGANVPSGHDAHELEPNVAANKPG